MPEYAGLNEEHGGGKGKAKATARAQVRHRSTRVRASGGGGGLLGFGRQLTPLLTVGRRSPWFGGGGLEAFVGGGDWEHCWDGGIEMDWIRAWIVLAGPSRGHRSHGPLDP